MRGYNADLGTIPADADHFLHRFEINIVGESPRHMLTRLAQLKRTNEPAVFKYKRRTPPPTFSSMATPDLAPFINEIQRSPSYPISKV